MNKITLISGLSLLASISIAQTPIASAIDNGAKVTLNDGASGLAGSDAQGNTIDVLQDGAAVSLRPEDTERVRAFTETKATWESAGKGSVYSKGGWDIYTVSSTVSASLNATVTGEPVWRYRFMATEDSVFTLDWDVVGEGSTLGLGRWVFTFTGPGGGEALGVDPLSPEAVGTLSRNLDAGKIYTVGLTNYGYIASDSGLIAKGSYDGYFNWVIKPIPTVPEPMTCLVLGGGLLAFARRRRARH